MDFTKEEHKTVLSGDISDSSSSNSTGRANNEFLPRSYRPVEILPPSSYKSIKAGNDKELKDYWLADSEEDSEKDIYRTAILKITTEDYDRENERMLISGAKLDHYKANPVVLWNHDTTIPAIGKALNVWTESNAIYIEAEFDNTDEFANKLLRKLRQGIIKYCSIGFIPLKTAAEKRDIILHPEHKETYENIQSLVTHTAWELFEVSLVNIPMNPYAGGALVPKSYQEKKQNNKNERGGNMPELYNPQEVFEKIAERLHKSITDELSDLPDTDKEKLSDRCIKNIFDPIYEYSDKEKFDNAKNSTSYFEKAIKEFNTQLKAGRKISNTNMNKLSQARDLLSAVIDSATVDNGDDDEAIDKEDNKNIKAQSKKTKRKVRYSEIINSK